MYPQKYFELFPVFPRTHTVFVAMSFAEQFERRWLSVIKPAIENVEIAGQRLDPHRVDTRQISDSILTEILEGVATARLIFADLTTIGSVGETAMRNANVLYEVGVAHAVRLPEEVLLFRSDRDSLLFDLANVRVNSYDPDENPVEARRVLQTAIIAALSEVDSTRRAVVARTATALDYAAATALWRALNGPLPHPEIRTVGQALANSDLLRAIQRLLELGLLRLRYPRVTPETVTASQTMSVGEAFPYEITEFGRAVLDWIGNKMNLGDPGLKQVFETLLHEKENRD